MNFNIKDVKLKDLDGRELDSGEIGKVLGNMIYQHSSTIEWLELAKAIHSGAEAEVTPEDLKNLKQFIYNCNLTLLAKDALIKYIDSIK